MMDVGLSSIINMNGYKSTENRGFYTSLRLPSLNLFFLWKGCCLSADLHDWARHCYDLDMLVLVAC